MHTLDTTTETDTAETEGVPAERKSWIEVHRGIVKDIFAWKQLKMDPKDIRGEQRNALRSLRDLMQRDLDDTGRKDIDKDAGRRLIHTIERLRRRYQAQMDREEADALLEVA